MPRPGEPSSDETIIARITQSYPTLSLAHRKAADFVLEHPFQAATMMIEELATAAGISVATANRFARALDLESYPAFRAELVRTFSSMLAPVEKLRAELQRAASGAEIMRASLEQELRNLQTTMHHLAAGDAERAVAAIIAAKRVFTIGFGTSAPLASYAAQALAPWCRFAQSAAAEGGAELAVRRMLRADAGDVVIGIATPRYSQDTIELMGFARERQATVVAITDAPASPAAQRADIVFCVGTEHALLTSSSVSAFALIEALSAAVARQAKGSLSAATELTDRLRPYLYSGAADPVASAAGRRRLAAARPDGRSANPANAMKGRRR